MGLKKIVKILVLKKFSFTIFRVKNAVLVRQPMANYLKLLQGYLR